MDDSVKLSMTECGLAVVIESVENDSEEIVTLKVPVVTSPVRPGVPNNDQFFNDLGLLIILYNCFFPGWFFKKS